MHLPRLLRLGSVLLGTTVLFGLGSEAASATTIRQGTPTTLPNATSPVVASGTQIGANGLAAPATFTAPSGNGSCTGGNFRGTVGTNPNSPDVLLTSPALRVDTCTDTIQNTNVNRIQLSNAPTLAARWFSNTGPNNGSVTIPAPGTSPAPTFQIVIELSGLLVPCNAVPVSLPVVATITNGSGSTPPSLRFDNLRLRTTAAPNSICANLFGDGSTPAASTVVNATFSPLRTVPASGTGNLIGIFQ